MISSRNFFLKSTPASLIYLFIFVMLICPDCAPIFCFIHVPIMIGKCLHSSFYKESRFWFYYSIQLSQPCCALLDLFVCKCIPLEKKELVSFVVFCCNGFTLFSLKNGIALLDSKLVHFWAIPSGFCLVFIVLLISHLHIESK